jgi:ribonuclease P protein component
MGEATVENALPDLFLGHSLWLGAMVPKRWAKRAVTRNAIKRQIYTVTGQFDAGMFSGEPAAAYVLRLRAAFDKKQFVSATSELLKQAIRAELLVLMARAGASYAGFDAAHPTTRPC